MQFRRAAVRSGGTGHVSQARQHGIDKTYEVSTLAWVHDWVALCLTMRDAIWSLLAHKRASHTHGSIHTSWANGLLVALHLRLRNTITLLGRHLTRELGLGGTHDW